MVRASAFEVQLDSDRLATTMHVSSLGQVRRL